MVKKKTGLFTMRSENPRQLRRLLNEVKSRLGVKMMEDAIIELVRREFPDIVMRYFPHKMKIEVIKV